LKTNHFPTYFLHKIGYSVFKDPTRPCDPQPKIWRLRPQPPELTPMVDCSLYTTTTACYTAQVFTAKFVTVIRKFNKVTVLQCLHWHRFAQVVSFK